MRSRRTSRLVLAILFVAAGVLHFVVPDAYVRTMPPWLPWSWALVLVSGAAEVAGGAGLLVRRTRRAAGIGLVLLLVAVWPANLQMLLHAREAGAPWWAEALLWLRLPLQLPLIAWVAWAAEIRRPAPPLTPPAEG